MEPEADTREVLDGLIEIMLYLIDNVWKKKYHIMMQSGGHTDENSITNFCNVIDEWLFKQHKQLAK
jgi:Flp pilus assembly CpaF family ATPase